jgi:hypothetical protein
MPVANVDVIAEEIGFLGRLARNMPPAWDGAKVRHIVKSPATGGYLGYLLPGRGYMPDLDLKSLGITKGTIPHVYERTLLSRLHDYLMRPEKRYNEMTGEVIDPERGAITTYDGIINARAGGKADDKWITKASFTTTANDWYCNARIATGMPGAMTFNSATAPTQAACDRTTAGNLAFPLFNPGGSDKKYLLTFGWVAAQQINCGILVDIHVQGGSFRLTVATAETVAAPVTITRTYYSPLGAGCYIVFVTTTGASATATNMTVTYVDQDNNAAQTFVIAGPATATIADQLWPDTSATTPMPFAPLAAGDYGVRSFSQTQLSGALAAGAVAGLIVTPLVIMPGIAANSYIERDSTVQVDGLTELVNVSQVIGALTLLLLPNTTSTGIMSGFMRTCSG